jgi:hypothetical protein
MIQELKKTVTLRIIFQNIKIPLILQKIKYKIRN